VLGREAGERVGLADPAELERLGSEAFGVVRIEQLGAELEGDVVPAGRLVGGEARRDGSLDRDAALAAVRRALPAAATEPIALSIVAEVLCICGDLDTADSVLGAPSPGETPALIAARGRVRLARGRVGQAREELARASSDGLDAEEAVRLAVDLAECALALGDSVGGGCGARRCSRPRRRDKRRSRTRSLPARRAALRGERARRERRGAPGLNQAAAGTSGASGRSCSWPGAGCASVQRVIGRATRRRTRHRGHTSSAR
jgi:hypothetical protein